MDVDESKPYTWKNIPGTDRFRAWCNTHGAMSWRLVNHKDYPDTVSRKVPGLSVIVRGKLVQVWKCTGDGCTAQAVC